LYFTFGPEIFTSVVNGYLPEPHASLLNGILFGINLKTSRVFYDQLKTVGLLHLVVLSGINITLLAAVIGQITNFLGKRVSILITILIVVLFIIFVGPKAPIIRAGFMGIFTLVSLLFGKKSYALWGLFLSLIFVLIFWPDWIKTVSLQLSYAACLGLALYGNVYEKKANDLKGRLFCWLWKEIKPSLAAQVFTAPIIFIYFKEVSLIGLVSNLLVSFTIAPLMIFGFITVVLGKTNYLLGLIPAYICYGLLSYIVFIIGILAKIPWALINFK